MADVTVTAAGVIPASNATKVTALCGAAIDAGLCVYLDSTDNRIKLANNLTSAATATLVGVTLNKSLVAEAPIEYASGGDIDPGFTVVVGQLYCLSDTNGGIMPFADLANAQRLVILGYGTSAANLRLLITSTGIVRA
jgi:hypothetical protein